MARRKKSHGSKKILVTKYKIALPLIIIGALYFFSVSFANNGPLLVFLKKYVSIAVGELGIDAFFGLGIITGIAILIKNHLITTLIKQFIASTIIISAILNFGLLDTTKGNYEQLGGYISWPLFRGLKSMFGEQSHEAIKIFVIILSLGLLAWIVYTFNIKLPSIKIAIETYDETKQTKNIKEEKIGQGGGFFSKIFGSGGSKQHQTSTITSTTIPVYDQEEKKPKSLIKDMLKGVIKQKIQEKTKIINFPEDKPTFDINILESGSQNININQNFLSEKASRLQNKLAEFNIPVEIQGFNVGPSVIQIKVSPSAGIKLSSIENLKNDIALALKTKSLRIISPIPGTDSVGIEIANPHPSLIKLRDGLEEHSFASAMSKNLTNLAMGKGIDGSFVVKSLEEMPHLLVAGSTGSGKSVGINDFILSLLYQNHPGELRFLMIDPKQVELSMYDGLPYLLAPVETRPERSLKILKRSVEEMERRYTLLKNHKVKNLQEYNKKSEEKLSRIVIVIDELADLMMNKSIKKDIETCITRIAQKARAAGMHLIIGTQRPSVDVITGLIKANIPTRIAFAVVSQTDSRTILDMKGAEDLVGKGDMLYIDPTTKFPQRIQAPYISTEEIENIIDHLKKKYAKDLHDDDIYNQELMNFLDAKNDTKGGTFGGGDENDDELVQKAIEIILETRKASATLLQRKLGVGFARAARIMDMLEEKGIVGPQEGAKPRDILI